MNSLGKNQVWRIVDRPQKLGNGKKANVIDSRSVFKRKVEPDGSIRHKARLVIRGFKDKNIYELSETYAPVSRLPLVRVVIAIINKYDLEVCQLDVKTAFLNGIIDEEIYMEISEGVDKSLEVKKGKVCKLERALYGLKISPKKWNDRFTATGISLGLENSDLKPCLFTWKNDDKYLILLLYVDDILVTSNDKRKLNEVTTKLCQEFEMCVLGEPREFLSIAIKRDRKLGCIELTQEKYINKILTRFGFHESHPQRTPMMTTQAANRERKEREDDDVDNTGPDSEPVVNFPYREAMGSLLYLAGATRPDNSYAVNILSRHQNNPTEDDWKMVKRVFRYLRGTTRLGLTYLGKGTDVQAYSDASFAHCKGSLTTSGYVIKLFRDAIVWRTHKQPNMATSTCHAEYVSLSETSQAMLSIYNSLRLMVRENLLPMTLWCDNEASKSNAETSGGNKLRHILEIKEHYVKECVKRKLINVRWVCSNFAF